MTARRALAVLGTGLAAAQAGHLLAYALRFGPAASGVQSTGAHAYFPALAKTGLGAVSLALVAALLVVGASRVLTGRRLRRGSAPSFLRLLAVLYAIQLACFAGQETLEALLGGAHPGSAPLLILWGAAGQLPAALAATLALRWLWARLEPALDILRVHLFPNPLVPAATAWRRWPSVAAPVSLRVRGAFHLRGPPSF